MVFFTASNLANFVVTFTLPFLLTEPAWLGSKVGFIFGTIAALGIFWAVFWMPELSNKTLEDIDEMFEAGVPAWRTRRKSPPHKMESCRRVLTYFSSDWKATRITENTKDGDDAETASNLNAAADKKARDEKITAISQV